MPYLRRGRRRRAARRIQRFFRHHRGKRRVVKRTSTRKLALINRRMNKLQNDRLECKYHYQGWNQLRVPPARAPVANGTMSTYQGWSTQLLTGIPPVSALAASAAALTDGARQILSANRREGKDVYISGIHAKLWFDFPLPTANTQKFPPWCDCHCAIVRERQNNSHNPAPNNAGTLPDNTATVKVPTTVDVFNTDADTAANPQQGALMWKNMQSGKNYIVAAHKKIRLSGFPLAAAGAAPQPRQTAPYTNSAKFMDFHYHPKCKVEFNSPARSVAATAATECPDIYRLVGQKNNVYLIFWSVTPVAPPGYTYLPAICAGNTVTRFTDS